MMGKGLYKRFYKFYKKYLRIVLLTNYNARCTLYHCIWFYGGKNLLRPIIQYWVAAAAQKNLRDCICCYGWARLYLNKKLVDYNIGEEAAVIDQL